MYYGIVVNLALVSTTAAVISVDTGVPSVPVKGRVADENGARKAGAYGINSLFGGCLQQDLAQERGERGRRGEEAGICPANAECAV